MNAQQSQFICFVSTPTGVHTARVKALDKEGAAKAIERYFKKLGIGVNGMVGPYSQEEISGLDVNSIMEGKHTIRLTESDLKAMVSECIKRLINEYHQNQQLMLPFDSSSEPYNYMQFVEWLETIGKYGELPAEPNAMNDVVSDEKFLYSVGEASFYYGTGDELDIDYLCELFADFVKKNGGNALFVNPNYTTDQVLEDIQSVEDIKTYLNENGRFLWERFVINRGRQSMDWWVNERLDINEKGLIYCERMIEMESSMERYHGENGEDYFETLFDEYDGIGAYWSYCPGGGNVYFNRAKHPQQILIKGVVSPRDVDWSATTSLESMDEQELRIEQGAIVQINEIEMWTHNEGMVRLPLKGSLLIPA